MGRSGGIVSFRLSAAAQVRVTIQRGCIARRCAREPSRAGAAHCMRPGGYVIRIRAVDAGGRVGLRAGRLVI